MPLTIPPDAIDKDTITETDRGDVSNCTSIQGHCYGSEGGTGVPEGLRVREGRGGEYRVQKLSTDRERLEEDAYYVRCQYCLKYSFVELKNVRDLRRNAL